MGFVGIRKFEYSEFVRNSTKKKKKKKETSRKKIKKKKIERYIMIIMFKKDLDD